MSMTYHEFKRELLVNISQQKEVKGKLIRLLERGCTSEIQQVQNIIKRINFTCFDIGDTVIKDDYICITWGEEGIGETLYWKVRDYFERYLIEGWQGVLPEILFRLQRTGHESKSIDRDSLVIRAVYYEQNKVEIADGIYRKYGDIALVLHSTVQGSETEYVSMEAAREIMLRWRMTADALLKYALLNSYAKMPPRLYYISDGRKRHDRQDGSFMADEKHGGISKYDRCGVEDIVGYRLTTAKGTDGVSALFYPGVQERLSEILDGDYYVDATDLDEVLIYPVRGRKINGIRNCRQERAIVSLTGSMRNRQLYRYCQKRMGLIEV